MECVKLLFPRENVEIPIKQNARDLGEIIQYTKSQTAKPLIDRLHEAIERIDRLRNLPLTIDQKALRIQTGVWPFGLCAADTHFLGMDHFAKLRWAAANSLMGAYHHVNPFLAMMCLSRYIQDPLLFVIINALRSVRRLFAMDPDLAKKFLHLACTFDASVAFGPASSLTKYLRKLNLMVTPEADIKTDEGICNISTASMKEI